MTQLDFVVYLGHKGCCDVAFMKLLMLILYDLMNLHEIVRK